MAVKKESNSKNKEKKNFPISDIERNQLIAERAFQKAQARNFENGTPEEDWLAAEKEINAEIHYVR